jgi:hypothetical protein
MKPQWIEGADEDVEQIGWATPVRAITVYRKDGKWRFRYVSVIGADSDRVGGATQKVAIRRAVSYAMGRIRWIVLQPPKEGGK